MNSRTKVLVTRWVVTVVMGLAVVGIAAACKINKEKNVEPETSEIYKLFAGIRIRLQHPLRTDQQLRPTDCFGSLSGQSTAAVRAGSRQINLHSK